MKKIRRKVLALLLAAVFLFGMVPTGVLAAENGPQASASGAAEVSPDKPAVDSAAPAPDDAAVPVIDSDLSPAPVTYYAFAYDTVQPLAVTAHASDGGTLSYQWLKGTSPNLVTMKIGYNSPTFYPQKDDKVGEKAGTTYYRVIVTNTRNGQTASANSAVAEIIVVPQPTITAKAVEAAGGKDIPNGGYSYKAGGTATALKAVASCSDSSGNPVEGGTWTYDWTYYKGDDPGYARSVPNGGGGQSYTPFTNLDGVFHYYCYLQYKAAGGIEASWVTNEVTVTVTADHAEKPTFRTQPVGGSYPLGTKEISDLSVDAEVTDGGDVSYQWYVSTGGKSFSKVDGATSSSYTPPSSNAAAVRYYYCEAANTLKSVGGGSFTSDPVRSDTATISFQNIPDAWQGSGTEDSPFLLSTAEDLQNLSKFVAQGFSYRGFTFEMNGDITLPQGWSPIGALKDGKAADTDVIGQYDATGKGTDIRPFSGTFDGGGNTLTVPDGGLPLFGYVRYATVKNLNIYGTKIAGYGLVNNYCVDYGPTGNYGDWTDGAGYPDMPLTVEIDDVTLKSGSSTLKSGFLGGWASGADTVIFRNCTVEKGVTVGYDGSQSGIGSFAGAFNGKMEGCISSAAVKGKDIVGGLVGTKGQSMGNCSIWDSAFHGTVAASGEYAGGLLGSGYNDASLLAGSGPNTPCITIQNCYADGSVTGSDYVGGLLGAEPSCRECWADGIGYIQNNYFSGKVSAKTSETAETDSGLFSSLKKSLKAAAAGIRAMAGIQDQTVSHVGGIIGDMKSLDRYNVISNNYYLNTCGADSGIGSVESVEKTPARNVAAARQNSINTVMLRQNAETLNAAAIPAGSGMYPGANAARYGRSDDPTGADAEKLTTAVTEEQFTADEDENDSVLGKLNGGVNSTGTWMSNFRTSYPTFSSKHRPHVVSFAVSGVSGASSLQCAHNSKLTDYDLPAVTADNQGDRKSVSQSDISFSGFDSATEGYETVTADYTDSNSANHAFLFEVQITGDEGGTGSPVTASFRMIGATKSNGPVDLSNGNYKGSSYVTWIPTKPYTLPAGSTVCNLFQKALGDAGLTSTGATGGYVSSVSAPAVCGGYALSAETNGPRSGWMYTINGSHSVESLKDQKLNNGDAVVFHYVDDYSYEVPDWFSEPGYPGLGDGKYYNEWLTAPDIAPTAQSNPGGGYWNGGVPAGGTTVSGVSTVTASNGGTVTTVTTQPDAAPTLTGGQSNISVTVPPEVAAVLSAATAKKPAEIKIDAPSSALLDQIGSSAVKTVVLAIRVPAAIAANTNANVKIKINVDASVLKATKQSKKTVAIQIINAGTGKEAYFWTFTGTGLADSVASVTGVDLALQVEPVAKNPNAAAVVAADTGDNKTDGTLLTFAGNGLLPAPASVRIYVGDQPGCKPGSKVYFYSLNSDLKTLGQMPAGECAVDSNGFVTVTISCCSDYVLLPKAAKDPYPVQSDTTYPLGVKTGKSYIFAVTASGGATPSLCVGNGKTFASSVKRCGNKYYFKVKAIGSRGSMTAVYCTLPKQKPTILCYLAVA